jgi:hypothetical protein
MPSDAQTFHVNQFGLFGFIVLLFFAPAFWIASDSFAALLVVLAIFIFTACSTYFLCTVAVSRSGIVLYRVNRAQWQDFTAARRTSFLGLPYLTVQRRKGLRWRIPLYLTKPEEFHFALTANAPIGNPLREYADNNV